ncbi:ribosomal RNA-processing protein 8-like isoform X2 [Actinidia eriantha]|uniref:ribosomal RNA-processing protein 8-like isoform X2 n=1 Tax=Actinidia eriantha TaxID=165200 RepID=UPI00258C7DDF|nr:ribosomal RNA-processing protein 8-like isoform X2 [Actinidia eriantha]
MKGEDRSIRKRKRPRHRKARTQKSSSNRKDTDDHQIHVSKKIDSDEEISKGASRSSAFLDKMRARLSGGHFRMINEKLYTCTGSEALNYFKEDPTLFNMDRSPSLLVADFGCGDARLARNVKNKVFSFDLVSNDPSVIACDMSNTPLDSLSIDVAVFCLSLMGTNFPSYLQEAHRVLKPSGWLLIAEVKSRFDPNTGGADPDTVSKAICELGFASVSKDFSNKMFILLYFKKKEKHSSKKREIEWPELKPCLYKRR